MTTTGLLGKGLSTLMWVWLRAPAPSSGEIKNNNNKKRTGRQYGGSHQGSTQRGRDGAAIIGASQPMLRT